MNAVFDLIQLSLVVVSVAGMVYTGSKMILKAFRVHFLWGVLLMLVPLILPLFVIRHWIKVGGDFLSCALFVALFSFAWKALPIVHTFVSETSNYYQRF